MRCILLLLFVMLLLPFSYADIPGGGDVTGFADADGPYSGVVNTSIQFYGNAVGGVPPYTYEWDFDYNGTFTVDSTEQNPTHNYTKPGTYRVALRVTDATGNQSIDVTLAYIYDVANKKPIVDFVWRPRYPKAGEIVRFYDLSVDLDGTIVKWRWDFGDGDVDFIRNPANRYDEPGNYTVTLTVWDDDGAKSTKSYILRVFEEIEEIEEENYAVVIVFTDELLNPLKGVDVRVYNESGLVYHLLSDENGSVRFEAREEIKVVATKEGYEKKEVNLFVFKDSSFIITMARKKVSMWLYVVLFSCLVAVAISVYKFYMR